MSFVFAKMKTEVIELKKTVHKIGSSIAQHILKFYHLVFKAMRVEREDANNGSNTGYQVFKEL